MKNEFVPYDTALAMKELGFYEDGLAIYLDGIYTDVPITQEEIQKMLSTPISSLKKTEMIVAPLYQQAFRWFREEYGFFYFINYLDPIDLNCMGIVAKMHKPVEPEYVTDSYETYEEAELACLRKLIEIVKEKQDENN